MAFRRPDHPAPFPIAGGCVETFEWVAPTAADLTDGVCTPPLEPGPIDLTWPTPPDPRYGPYQPYSVFFEAYSPSPGDAPGGNRRPRVFYFQRLNRSADDLSANEFLLEMCGYGMRTMYSEFRWSADRWTDYKVAHALFARRFQGRFKVRRHLRSPRDFFEVEGPQKIQCLVPGTDVDPHQFPKYRLPSQRELAAVLFRALNRPNWHDNVLTAVLDHLYDFAVRCRELHAEKVKPAAVHPESIEELFRLLAQAGVGPRTPRDPRGPLQGLGLVEPVADSCGHVSAVPPKDTGHIATVSFSHLGEQTVEFPPEKVAAGVRSAVVGSYCSPDDVAAVMSDRRDRGGRSAYDRLLNALRHRLIASDRRSFCRWLQRELSRGFVSVLPPGDRENPVEQTLLLESFALLQWASIELMAECYGAVIAMINADFRVGSPANFRLEEDLFAAMYLRHAALAGLPLCFLGAAAQEWASDRFFRLVIQEVIAPQRYASVDRVDDSDGSRLYDIAVALGLYGDLVREVRAADQRRKRRKAEAARGRSRQTTPHD